MSTLGATTHLTQRVGAPLLHMHARVPKGARPADQVASAKATVVHARVVKSTPVSANRQLAVNGIVSGPVGNAVGENDRLAVRVEVSETDADGEGVGSTTSVKDASMIIAVTDCVLK